MAGPATEINLRLGDSLGAGVLTITAFFEDGWRSSILILGTAPTAERCKVDKDLFASEFVIRAYREGKRVVEIPVEVLEKRTPSINLVRRVPNVMRNMARLAWLFRVEDRS